AVAEQARLDADALVRLPTVGVHHNVLEYLGDRLLQLRHVRPDGINVEALPAKLGQERLGPGQVFQVAEDLDRGTLADQRAHGVRLDRDAGQVVAGRLGAAEGQHRGADLVHQLARVEPAQRGDQLAQA